jgi:hypothetical protein
MNANAREFLQGVGPVPLVGPKQEVQLRHVMQDGPSATPVVVQGLIPVGGGVQALVSFGGLTKLEVLAGLIASGMSAHLGYGEDFQTLAAKSVESAQAVLDECKARQTPDEVPA